MASSDATQRAVLAGLSCGIGLAAPVVMYAATLPFSSVNETVVAGAVPFAVGAVAGVGIYAASLGISEYRAQREERLFQPDAMGGAANLNQHQSEFKTASIPAQQQDAIPYAAASASQAQSEQSTSAFLSGLTGAFQRRHADDGVPTIARAADAMDEAEAWSMIDSMLDDDSPVSCDPARSRDVYQVAIDELTNGGQTGSFNRDDIAAAARAVSGSQAAPAGSTAAFVALVANAAVNNAYSATSADANASADNSYVDEAMTADEEAVAARRAAESSLWGAPAQQQAASAQQQVVVAQQQAAEAAPYNANLASMPIISGAAGIDLDDLDEPAAITASIDAQDRIDTGDLPDASLEVDVPMADYSGHEGMWAAATAILDEIDEPAPVSAPAPVAAPQPAAPAYVGRHSAVFPEDTARISRESIERAEAIAAGIMENRRHERVNQILEEEIERLQSSTAKRTGRAYLSVIEGGTASFAPLRAEA